MAVDTLRYSPKFLEADHAAFFLEQTEAARKAGKRVDSYFCSLVYLLGLMPETRIHFQELFHWQDWGICPEALSAGWQTGGTLRITRLAFNLWNGFGSDSQDGGPVSEACLPDNPFCCSLMEYFFEAIRLRFPECASGKESLC